MAPQNTPSAWWSEIGHVWLPGTTISGPFSGPQSSR